MLETGHRLTHYEIVQRIGKGGMDSPRLVKRKPVFFW
jgi:hypothetical protein